MPSLVLVAASTAAAASPPTVKITAPGGGETVEGTVRVEATATAAAGEYPTGIEFYDGANEIGRASCQSQQTCTVYVEWQATGLSGQHELTAVAETNTGQTATSAVVAVKVSSPGPTVHVTSPIGGTHVEGTVMVSAEASTDPSQDEYPTEIRVYDGVNELGGVHCQAQRVCQGQVEWPATGLSGTHVLSAKVDTSRGIEAASPEVDVTVLSPAPHVSITHPTNGSPLGGTIALGVSGYTASSQDEVPNEIVAYDGSDEIGSVRCQGQQTCAGSVPWNTSGLKGAQKLTAVIHTSRSREATSSPVYVGGSPGKARAKVSCHLTSSKVPVKHRDWGSCTTSNVPPGTHTALQVRTSAAGQWTTIATGKVNAAGHYIFWVRNPVPITIEVSVLISASSRSTADRVAIETVTITASPSHGHARHRRS